MSALKENKKDESKMLREEEEISFSLRVHHHINTKFRKT